MPSDMVYQGLLQERAELTSEARATIDTALERDDHAMTAEETERDDQITVKIDALNKAIEMENAQRNRDRTVAMGPKPEPEPEPVPGFHGGIKTTPNTLSGGPYASFGHQLQDIATAKIDGPESGAAKERLQGVIAFH